MEMWIGVDGGEHTTTIQDQGHSPKPRSSSSNLSARVGSPPENNGDLGLGGSRACVGLRTASRMSSASLQPLCRRRSLKRRFKLIRQIHGRLLHTLHSTVRQARACGRTKRKDSSEPTKLQEVVCYLARLLFTWLAPGLSSATLLVGAPCRVRPAPCGNV